MKKEEIKDILANVFNGLEHMQCSNDLDACNHAEELSNEVKKAIELLSLQPSNTESGEVEIIFNGGKTINISKKDYLKNKEYWDGQSAIIKELSQQKEGNWVSDFEKEFGLNIKEASHVLNKVKKVKIVNNFKEVLIKEYGEETYKDKEGEEFFNKYTGNVANVYEWCGDWWICEDDNYVITKECFNILK